MVRQSAQAASGAIDEKRWSWVRSRMADGEARIVTSPAYMFTGGPRPGCHAFLTDQQVLTAVTEPPFGSEGSPMVFGCRIDQVARLAVSDGGLLLVVGPDSHGDPRSIFFDLYPSPISQRLVQELRDRWVALGGGRQPEGSWNLWLGESAPMAIRSSVAWARGK